MLLSRHAFSSHEQNMKHALDSVRIWLYTIRALFVLKFENMPEK